MCHIALRKLLDTFENLGLLVALDKLEGPGTIPVFLGFELDSRAFEVHLSQRKLDESKELIQQWQRKTSCGMKDLESLIGKLAHAVQVVSAGRTFLRRMFELKMVVRHIKKGGSG